MYGLDADVWTSADGRIPEALLSDDGALADKAGGEPEVMPGADDGDRWFSKEDDAPLVLPGADTVFVFEGKDADRFEVLPGLDARTLFPFEPTLRPDTGAGRMLTVDEQGVVLDQFSCGGGRGSGVGRLELLTRPATPGTDGDLRDNCCRGSRKG